jgi:spore germination cell wall hydrolase CwlJ-like protein
LGIVGPAASPQTTAYHPSAEALSFKSKGESQAEFEERERHCLATAIYFEARGEPVRGQIAVGQVILNRVRSLQFPQTICGVVYQGQGDPGCQFSFACDGHTDMPKQDAHWALAQSLARQITSGQVWLPEVGYSTYYHADYVRPGWVNAMNKIDSIGRHIFYKKRNEKPYVVQEASVAAATTAQGNGAPQASPSTAMVSLASSSPSDGSIGATPAIGLGLTPSQ